MHRALDKTIIEASDGDFAEWFSVPYVIADVSDHFMTTLTAVPLGVQLVPALERR